MFWKNLLSFSKRFDWPIFIAAFFLVCISLAALFSIAQSQDQPSYGLLIKQGVAALLGFLLLAFFSWIDYRQWQKFSWAYYVGGALILIAVVLFGREIRGTKGWLVIAGFQWQVVEAVKFCLIIFLANFLAKFGRNFEWPQITISGALTFLIFGLIMLQPDFGSAMVVFFLWFASLFLARTKISKIVTVVALMLITAGLAWQFYLADYQKARITSFVNPAEDPYGQSYNVTQAKVAVGAGRLFGRGLGFGTQSQLRFIPEAQTDFIFAVIAEELGLIGVLLLFGLYGIIFWRGIMVAKEARDDFGIFLVLLTLLMFFCHIFVNIGMNIDLLPVTGIALPFVSQGGSYLLICLAGIGLIQSVARQSRKIKYD